MQQGNSKQSLTFTLLKFNYSSSFRLAKAQMDSNIVTSPIKATVNWEATAPSGGDSLMYIEYRTVTLVIIEII